MCRRYKKTFYTGGFFENSCSIDIFYYKEEIKAAFILYYRNFSHTFSTNVKNIVVSRYFLWLRNANTLPLKKINPIK